MELTEYNINISPLTKEDGGGFMASVAELPGCLADGATVDEALYELNDAFQAWKFAQREDGKEMPVAKTYSGQFVARIPKSLHARLVQKAQSEGVSINQLNVEYIAEGLARL